MRTRLFNRSIGRRSASGRRSEAGAVLLEAIIITPLLLMLTLGVFDLGMGWRASLTVTSAARAGARVGSNLGQDPQTDAESIKGVAASINNEGIENIDSVIIYKSTSADGTVPSQCLTPGVKATGGSTTYSCNVYSAAEVEAISTGDAGAPTFNGNCSTSRDRFWCPTTRQNLQSISPGPDYLGVYVNLTHQTFTKLFGPTMNIDDHAVMRIEPQAGA